MIPVNGFVGSAPLNNLFFSFKLPAIVVGGTALLSNFFFSLSLIVPAGGGGGTVLLNNWSERSACAALGCWHKRRWPL